MNWAIEIQEIDEKTKVKPNKELNLAPHCSLSINVFIKATVKIYFRIFFVCVTFWENVTEQKLYKY